MSMQVELDELAATVARYGFAYLVTVGDGSRAHVLAVATEVDGASLRITGAGSRAPANAAVRPDVTLVYPPVETGGMSLLVDGRASVDGETIVVEAARAVRHRAAPTPERLG